MTDSPVADLYARKSTKDAGRSAARQERDWRADCTTEGIEPGRVFVDPDLSASRFARQSRPDYDALLQYIRAGDCRMLALWEASRGTRQLAEWVALLDLCRTTGTLIRVFGEPAQTFDPRIQRDRDALVSEGMRAEGESEKLSLRVRAGTRDAAARGIPAGPLLYGYRRVYDDRRQYKELIVVAEEAALIRQLAADTLDGLPLQTQANTLNRNGVPTPARRGLWTGSHIRRMLLNPGYQGHRVYHGEVISRAAWPAIVDDDLARQLRAALERPGRRTNHGGSQLLYQLSGAGVCGRCEQVLRTAWRTRYICGWPGCRSVVGPMDRMDEVVDAMVRARLSQPDAAAVFAPRTDDAAAAAARRELTELRSHLDGFYDQAAARRLSAAGLARVEARLLPQIGAAERRLRDLSTPPALRDLAGVDVAGTWADLPVGVRREVIVALAVVRLSPVGKGGRWSPWRLAESRWHGDRLSWGERWRRDGLPTTVGAVRRPSAAG